MEEAAKLGWQDLAEAALPELSGPLHLRVTLTPRCFWGGKRLVWQERAITLADGELVYSTQRAAGGAGGSDVYADDRESIEVTPGTAVDLEGDGRKVLAITCKSGRIFRFLAETQSAAKKWQGAIRRTSRICEARRDQRCDVRTIVVAKKEGSGLGIDVDFAPNRGYVTVDSVKAGHATGLQSGDILLEVNGKSLEGVPVSDALALLTGQPCGHVTFKAARPRPLDAGVSETDPQPPPLVVQTSGGAEAQKPDEGQPTPEPVSGAAAAAAATDVSDPARLAPVPVVDGDEEGPDRRKSVVLERERPLETTTDEDDGSKATTVGPAGTDKPTAAATTPPDTQGSRGTASPPPPSAPAVAGAAAAARAAAEQEKENEPSNITTSNTTTTTTSTPSNPATPAASGGGAGESERAARLRNMKEKRERLKQEREQEVLAVLSTIDNLPEE